jgi:hypothetical protein
MRKVTVIAVAAFLIGSGELASPPTARAADTPTTFELDPGTLTLTVPTQSVTLDTVTVGVSTVSGQLGTVSVDDERGLLPGSWTVSVVSSDFVGNTTDVSLPASGVAYTPGDPTATFGTGDFTPGTAGEAIGTPQTAYSAADEQGSAGVSWDPTITITLPNAGQVADIYSGTITHSIA